ncbi:ankyrin [Armillaria fumosa]|nr:ankyrin [Armillaria fumosa]
MSLPAATIEFAHSMFDAARNGDASVLVPALTTGLPPDLTNPEGNTLLMLAAYAGHHALAKELISRGADPNRLNDRGQSIVAGAVFKGYGETVMVLVEAGADPRKGKPSAIEAAYMFGRRDLMEVLGAKEGDVGEDVPRPVAGLS